MQRKRITDKEIVPSGRDPDALLQALEQLLAADKALKKGARVDVTVSDSVAAIIAVPWQDKLVRPAELQGYARAVFDRSGAGVDDSWVMHVEYRHFGAAGLAYAFPKAWLEKLRDLLGQRGLRLRTVLPVSAAAYHASRVARARGGAAILLQDSARCSALMFGAAGLAAFDTEPAIGSAAESMERLFRRIQAKHASIHHVLDWSPDSPTKAAVPAPAMPSMPEAQWQVLVRNAWGIRS
jgi:hypothetical protein